MGSLSATPQNSILGALADALMSARGYANRMQVPVIGGLGDALLGTSPEEIENWSYGNSPIRMPQQSNIPIIPRDRAAALLATAGLLPMAKPMVSAGRGIGKMALEELANRVESGAGVPGLVPMRKYAVPPDMPGVAEAAANYAPEAAESATETAKRMVLDLVQRKRMYPTAPERGAPVQYEGQQRVIPGLRALEGVKMIEPGVYEIDASKFNQQGLVDQWMSNLGRRAAHEGSDSFKHPSNNAYEMMGGVLGDLRAAVDKDPEVFNPNLRAILELGPQGDPVAAGSFDLQKGKNAMEAAGRYNPFDFTDPNRLEPVYMPHLARMPNTPESIRGGFHIGEKGGKDIVEMAQKLYGPNIQFDVWNPKVNEDVYRNMGATFIPELNEATGKSIYGSTTMPAYEWTGPVARKVPVEESMTPGEWLEQQGQQRLEGFRKGGAVNAPVMRQIGAPMVARPGGLRVLTSRASMPMVGPGVVGKMDMSRMMGVGTSPVIVRRMANR